MNNTRKKAVSLVGEEQVCDIEQAFNLYLSCWVRMADKSLENLCPYDFFSNYLADKDVHQGACQAFRKLNTAGIDLQMMLGEMWVECEPEEERDQRSED